MKTIWNEERLRRLYRRYNRRFWNGALPETDVVIDKLPHAMGLHDARERRITIDVERHSSDREVRCTLLHEMAHAATGMKGKTAHGTLFFTQIERLLRKGAPLSVGFPETGSVNLWFLESVPKRFVLCRRALRVAVDRQQRRILKATNGEENLEEVIIEGFKDAGTNGQTWEQAVRGVGHHFGLLDIDGLPLPFLKRCLPEARRVHRNEYKLWQLSQERKGAVLPTTP